MPSQIQSLHGLKVLLRSFSFRSSPCSRCSHVCGRHQAGTTIVITVQPPCGCASQGTGWLREPVSLALRFLFYTVCLSLVIEKAPSGGWPELTLHLPSSSGISSYRGLRDVPGQRTQGLLIAESRKKRKAKLTLTGMHSSKKQEIKFCEKMHFMS